MFDLMKRAARGVADVVETGAVKTAAFSALFLGVVAPSFAAEGDVTLPSTGVDVSAYATTAITSIGAIVAVCVGGYFAFKLVKIGIKWAGSMLSRG